MQRTKKKQIKTKQIDDTTLNKLVSAINRLYITNRKTYLKQYIDNKTLSGMTVTVTYDATKPQNNNNLPLNDKLIKRHIIGKQHQNFGVINPKITKMMTFDFDIEDENIRTFYYRKVQYALHDLGIEENNYIVNRSGKKGIHLTLFFDKVLTIKAQKLYKYVLQSISDTDIDNTYLSKTLKKSIELKGLTQGVKLPFSYHIETGQRACILHRDTLEPTDDLNICECNPLLSDTLDDILERLDDALGVDISDSDKKLIGETKQLLDSVKSLEIYKLGHDKEYTSGYLNKLLLSDDAIKQLGTRNDMTYMLAIHLKDSYGMTEQTALDTLNEWISRQNRNSYTTPLQTCYEENKATVKSVYTHDYHLSISSDVNDTLKLYRHELVTILTVKRASDNKPFTLKQRAIFFAMLLHSKRYTSDDNDTFYMSYKQMHEATDTNKPALVSNTIRELEALGYLEVVRRNALNPIAKDDERYKKLPNVYRMTMDNKKDAASVDRTSNVKGKAIRLRSSKNDEKTFIKIISKNFTRKELKAFKLSNTVINYFLN